MNEEQKYLPPPASDLPAETSADPTAYLPKVQPGRWFGVMKRRGWLVVLVAMATVGGMVAWIGHAKKIYRAEGAVYVSTEAPHMLDIKAVVPEESRDLEQLRSVADGMLSSTLLLRVIERNHLDADPTYADGVRGEQGLLEKFRDSVSVELRRGTRIIDIQAEDADPERARDIVASIKSEYERWTAERREKLTEEVSRGLAREEQRLRQKMEESARNLEKFRQTNAVPGLDTQNGSAPTNNELESLRSQWTQARAERLRLEAQVEALGKLDAEDPDSVAGLANSDDARELLSLVRTLRDKQIEFARIKERYMYKHPLYKEAANEIAGLKKTIEEATRAATGALEKRYRVALENENKLAAEVKRARSRAVEVEGLRAKFATLEREARVDRDLHATVARRLRETALAASAPKSILRWEEVPLIPEKPWKPRKQVLLATAGFGGLFLGFLMALALELKDRRLRDDSMAAKVLGVPMLSRVPAAKYRNHGALIMIYHAGSEAAEGFRRLRAVLAPPKDAGPGRTILFTSSRKGEGKSFNSLNYAASLALQGYRTLLIDADLRQGTLSRHPSVGGNARPGLGDYLAAVANPADACVPSALPKLYLLAAGSGRDDGAELLGGVRFPALLRDAFRWFDRVVIDTPAVLDASDVQAIARYADDVCLVVNPRKIDRRDLEHAASLLRASSAKLTGFIWNEGPSDATEDDAPYLEAHPEALGTREEPAKSTQGSESPRSPSSSKTILSIRRSA